MPTPSGRRTTGTVTRPIAQILAVLALVACVGSLRFGNDFVWDDIPMFVQGDGIYQIENLPTAFVHNTMYLVDGGAFAANADLDTYRPLTMATFILDGAWGGRRPLPFHVTGLLIHLAVVALLFALGRRLLAGAAQSMAWAPALWFGLHPLLTEAHVWINGRSDTLCGAFVLANALVWLGPPTRDLDRPNRPGRGVASFALVLAGALCKEIAVIALVPLTLWRLGAFSLQPALVRARLGATLRDLIAPALAVAAYVALRLNALEGAHVSGGADHLGAALLRVPFFVLDGLAHVVVPTSTAVRYLQQEYAVLSTELLVAAWGVLAVGMAAALAARRRVPLLGFGLVWFACTLAPGTLISLLAWYGFARYLYVPATLLALAATALVGVLIDEQRIGRTAQRVLAGAFALYMAAFAALSAVATRDWRSTEAWYAAAMRDYPDSSHGWGGWGKVLVEQQRYEEAIPLLEAAAERALPTDSRPLNNLAQAWLRAGDPERAAAVARVGIQQFPREAKFFHVLAVAAAPSRVEAAAEAIVGALDRDPNYGPSHQLIAQIQAQHPERARFAAALQALLAAPEHAAARAALQTTGAHAPDSPAP